ncbi:thioredoxin family protein [Pedobacter boryungensis]|uniref:Thioredoxin family protein n=1 Tax=Pedobacter boryungensis TaxID=869962 RepID=A0ABX2DCE5_9SPHI|nr:thioredoxin family protein [Pedobacter boryungensis]NQX31620.1 thioredoxin family protein [Pedobacter boryungensis]
MKSISIALFAFLFVPQLWSSNFPETQKKAKTTHQLILVNFSGSDWCGPCIRLREEIFESTVFEKYASTNLLLVRADFPRQKKNQLSKEQVKLNESLAEQYNKDGRFPFTLLVDENGKVLKTWDGYPDETPEQFISDIVKISTK